MFLWLAYRLSEYSVSPIGVRNNLCIATTNVENNRVFTTLRNSRIEPQLSRCEKIIICSVSLLPGCDPPHFYMPYTVIHSYQWFAPQQTQRSSNHSTASQRTSHAYTTQHGTNQCGIKQRQIIRRI